MLNLYDTESEEILIASLLRDHRNLSRVNKKLTEDDFTSPYRQVLNILNNMAHESQMVDLMHLKAEFNKKYEPKPDNFFSDLWEACCTSAGTRYYIEQVYNASKKRQLYTMNQHVMKALDQGRDLEDCMTYAREELMKINTANVDDIIPMSEALQRGVKQIEHRAEHGNRLAGYSTGLTKLNTTLSGLKAGKLYIVAGRPAMGKSILGYMFAEFSGVPTSIFNFEMSIEEQVERSIAGSGPVDFGEIQSGTIKDGSWDMISSACERLSTLPITFIDNVDLHIDQLVSYVETLHMDGKADLVVVDYLQLIEVSPTEKKNSRERQVSDISRKLKKLAKRLKIPVVVLCQLNREVDSRTDHTPVMSDLRESGSLEQDADSIIFVKRDAAYSQTETNKEQADICVAKNRNGKTGVFKARFLGHYQKFYDEIGE